MRKILEILVIGLVVSLVLVLGASVVLHIVLPPEKAKALVLKQLTGHLKREVQVGTVSVGVFSGLDVSDLKISEAPDFAHGTFISSERFVIRVSLLPLLFRKVVLNQLVLGHPVIHIVRFPDGKTFNFSDLISTTTAPAPMPRKTAQVSGQGLFEIPAAYAATPMATEPARAEGPPFYFLVSNAQIQHGIIHFEDRSPAKQSVDVDPLDLKLRNVSLTSPFSVQTSLKAKSRGIEVALQLAGEADLKTESVKIKNCTLSSGGSTVALSGQANNLKSGHPKVDLRLVVKEFKLATLAPFVPLPAGFSLVGPIIAEVRVKGDQERMNFSALTDLTKVKVVVENEFTKPARVPLVISLQGQLTGLRDVEVQGLKAVLGSLELKGHGRVIAVTSPQPQMNFHLESNSFPVVELAGFASQALPKELGAKGNAQLSVDVSGTQISSRLSAKCEGKDLALSWADLFAKPVGVPFRVTMTGEMLRSHAETTINFQPLNATLSSIDVSATGSIVTGGRTPKFQLTLVSNALPLKDLAAMVPMMNPYNASGLTTLNAKVSGSLSAPAASGTLGLQNVSARYQQSELSQINATVNFTQQDVSIPKLTGKLNGSDVSLKLAGHRLTTQPDVNVDATITLLDLDKLLPPMAVGTESRTGSDPLLTLGSDPIGLALMPVVWAAPVPTPLPPMKLSGHLAVGRVKHEFYDAQSLDLKWNLTDVTPDLSRINGTAALKQGPGKLTNVEKLAALSKTAKVMLLPVTTLQKMDKTGVLSKLGLPSLQTIPFDGIRGDYQFQAGTMNIKTFELTGRDLNVSTLGTIGLAGEQPLDLRVTMKLAPGSIGGTVGELVTDESGRPTLAFTAQGPAASPRVRLDVREASQKAIQKVGEQLLKNLGVGGNTSSPPPASNDNGSQAPAQNNPPPNNPADQIQKTLDNLKNIFH